MAHRDPSKYKSRQHESVEDLSHVGRSVVYATCPFCKRTVRAFSWSLAGSGKRCPGCGAIHGGQGTTMKKREDKENGNA